MSVVHLVDLPVIDLNSIELCQEMLRAHEQYGLFQISNHGIPAEVMYAVVNACREFFTSSQECKDALAADGGYRKEGYNQSPSKSTFGMRIQREHLYLYLNPIWRRNPRKWPSSHKDLVEVLGDYSTSVYKKLVTAMAKNLNLEPREILHSLGDDMKQTFCAFSYPSSSPKGGVEEAAIGVPNHTDIGTLVLLFADETPGLQVLKNGEWKTVRPIPGSIIVSLGEILEVLSNGIFRAPQHRVLLNSGHPRISCAVTFEPAEKSMIAPALSRLDRILYRSFIYEERYREYEQGRYAKRFAML